MLLCYVISATDVKANEFSFTVCGVDAAELLDLFDKLPMPEKAYLMHKHEIPVEVFESDMKYKFDTVFGLKSTFKPVTHVYDSNFIDSFAKY